jgi:hypothetical protein
MGKYCLLSLSTSMGLVTMVDITEDTPEAISTSRLLRIGYFTTIIFYPDEPAKL